MPLSAFALDAEQLSQQRWIIVNDTVMGGRSRSQLDYLADEGILRFSGRLSLENRGGFASVRLFFEPGIFAKAYAICVRVRGDGRRYQLRLRNDSGVDGISYHQYFHTVRNQWKAYTLSIATFIPSYRGRTLTGRDPIRPAEIRQVGFMLADKRAGPFQLDIQSVAPCWAQGENSPDD